MLKKVEHIGIAVDNLEESRLVFDALLGKESYKTEEVKTEEVKTLFYQVAETKIELLEATNPESPIAKYLGKHKQGLHHVAFEVENIEKEVKRLVEKGFIIISTPKNGADNKRICFLHPKKTSGVLIELCQEIK